MKTFVWHEADSFLHRLNPLTKLALVLPVTVLVSSTYEPVPPAALAAISLLATRALGRVPWLTLLRPLGLAMVLGFGMLWTGAAFYSGDGAEAGAPAIWLGPAPVATARLVYGTAMAARLLAIFSTSLLFVLTTDPTRFVLALIQQARLPYRVGYGVFVAYRFVPLLQEEFDTIRAAHHLRGGLPTGGLVARARQLAGYLIPLLAIAVRKGERVALAMDSRAFGALPHRTYYRTTAFTRDDLLFALGSTITLSLVVLAANAIDGGG